MESTPFSGEDGTDGLGKPFEWICRGHHSHKETIEIAWAHFDSWYTEGTILTRRRQRRLGHTAWEWICRGHHSHNDTTDVAWNPPWLRIKRWHHFRGETVEVARDNLKMKGLERTLSQEEKLAINWMVNASHATPPLTWLQKCFFCCWNFVFFL